MLSLRVEPNVVVDPALSHRTIIADLQIELFGGRHFSFLKD
jgi:hypothetical protein